MKMKNYNLSKVFKILCALSLLSFNVKAINLPNFTELVANNGAAVVNISTIKNNHHRQMPNLPPGMRIPEGTPFDELYKHFFNSPEGRLQPYESHSLGSGFVLSSDGYILTNYHVIRNADKIIVRFSDHNELEAKILGSDARSDVALLKVKATNLISV